MQGSVWVHTRTDMRSNERAVMGLKSRAVLGRVKYVINQHTINWLSKFGI